MRMLTVDFPFYYQVFDKRERRPCGISEKAKTAVIQQNNEKHPVYSHNRADSILAESWWKPSTAFTKVTMLRRDLFIGFFHIYQPLSAGFPFSSLWFNHCLSMYLNLLNSQVPLPLPQQVLWDWLIQQFVQTCVYLLIYSFKCDVTYIVVKFATVRGANLCFLR